MTFCERLSQHALDTLSLAHLMPYYSLNLRKYEYLLRHLPCPLGKLNLSHNLLLPVPLTTQVMYRVTALNIT